MGYGKFIKKIGFFLSIMSLCHCTLAAAAWGSAEYLYWWVQDSPVSVPLVTQNNNPAAFGIIGEPGTQIIFGKGSNQNAFEFGGMSGVRINLGTWIDEGSRYGIEASAFSLADAKNTFSASSFSGTLPIINIPFFSVDRGIENILVNRLPNVVTVSDSFRPYGVELNGLYRFQDRFSFPLILIAGFRYLNMNEDFELNDALYNAPSFENSVVNVRDDFSTRNDFYGFQLGAKTHFSQNNFVLDVLAKVALGNNHQKLTISGQTNVNKTTILQPIGTFAEPTNIGTYTNNQFAVVPEIIAKLGYNLTRYIRPFIAYNFLYINNVIRPGQQIDRNINQTQNTLIGGSGVLTGPAAPTARFNNTGLWMQGVSGGLELSFY